MNNLQITGLERGAILKEITKVYPEWHRPENRVRQLVGPRNKREVHLEQGAAIAYLASQYNRSDARILEIGAARGYSAGILALAAPLAKVATLEPHAERVAAVRGAVGQLGVTVLQDRSTDYLSDAVEIGETYDMIFVDGDHANVAHDLPFYNLLRKDGLFLHHDYSPLGSARECVPVFDALNHFGTQLGRMADVLVQDNTLVALAGWYKRDGEVWPPDGRECGDDGYVIETELPAGQQSHAFDSEKGVICRHCLKTDDDGDHVETDPEGRTPDEVEADEDAAVAEDAPALDSLDTASGSTESQTKTPRRRRSGRSKAKDSSDA